MCHVWPVSPPTHARALSGGGMRSLSGMEEVEAGAPSDGGRLLLTALFWALRLLIAAVCFGWMTFKSLPGIQANPDAGNNYWKFQVQAKKDLERVGGEIYRLFYDTSLPLLSRYPSPLPFLFTFPQFPPISLHFLFLPLPCCSLAHFPLSCLPRVS